MNWQEVCEHPDLKNLPFRIELNERGQIVMSPVKIIHSFYQGEIEHLLRSLTESGTAMPECAISTHKGTKVADVVWISSERSKSVFEKPLFARFLRQIQISILNPPQEIFIFLEIRLRRTCG
jgi:hypothetical protein